MEPTLSPQGQWKWDEAKQDWVPNTQTQTTSTSTTGSTGGVNSEAFKRAALLDLLKTGGKNLVKLKAAQDIIAPTPSAGEEKTAQAGITETIRSEFGGSLANAEGITPINIQNNPIQKSLLCLLKSQIKPINNKGISKI